MNTRPFEKADTDAVVRLWSDCGLVVPQNDPLRDIERKQGVNPELFLVGEDDTGIIASVMGGYEGHRGWINYLAVAPTARRRGYGEAMMRAVEALLRERGCPKINLQVRRSNEEVLQFYRAIGYAVDDVVGLGKRLEYDSV